MTEAEKLQICFENLLCGEDQDKESYYIDGTVRYKVPTSSEKMEYSEALVVLKKFFSISDEQQVIRKKSKYADR